MKCEPDRKLTCSLYETKNRINGSRTIFNTGRYSHRASDLKVTEAIVQWMERAVNALRNHCQGMDDTLLQYLSPLGWLHINLTGD
jgi:hypothetical protein